MQGSYIPSPCSPPAFTRHTRASCPGRLHRTRICFCRSSIRRAWFLFLFGRAAAALSPPGAPGSAASSAAPLAAAAGVCTAAAAAKPLPGHAGLGAQMASSPVCGSASRAQAHACCAPRPGRTAAHTPRATSSLTRFILAAAVAAVPTSCAFCSWAKLGGCLARQKPCKGPSLPGQSVLAAFPGPG
jgi:hypothetical protein